MYSFLWCTPLVHVRGNQGGTDGGSAGPPTIFYNYFFFFFFFLAINRHKLLCRVGIWQIVVLVGKRLLSQPRHLLVISASCGITSCVGLTDSDYDFMRSRKGLGFCWFCGTCISSADGAMGSDRTVNPNRMESYPTLLLQWRVSTENWET